MKLSKYILQFLHTTKTHFPKGILCHIFISAAHTLFVNNFALFFTLEHFLHSSSSSKDFLNRMKATQRVDYYSTFFSFPKILRNFEFIITPVWIRTCESRKNILVIKLKTLFLFWLAIFAIFFKYKSVKKWIPSFFISHVAMRLLLFDIILTGSKCIFEKFFKLGVFVKTLLF